MFDKHVEHAEPLPLGCTYPFAFFLAIKLLDAGHQVTVVTSGFDVPHRMAWTGREGRLKVIAVHRRRTYYYCCDVYRREVRAMRAELKQVAPDIIHAQWTYEYADAALSTGLPCLVTARDAPWLIAWHFRKFYRLYRALYSSLWIIPGIRHFTCVSPHIKRIYEKEPFFRTIRTSVIPNGLERGLFASGPKDGIHDLNAPCFVSVSGWGRLKNVPCLLRAFAIVHARYPGATLVLVGSGLGKDQEAEIWAREKKLSDGIVFRGSLPYRMMLNVLENEADLFVHTTKEESFSMTTLEAMAKGAPVIGGRESGGVPWLLDNGAAGVVVDINSPEAVAAGMIHLVQNPEQYKTIAQCAYQRAIDLFTMDTVAQQYQKEYENVLQPAKR
jgi:glycosyltransferase involved in cell wall biosynthesis